MFFSEYNIRKHNALNMTSTATIVADLTYYLQYVCIPKAHKYVNRNSSAGVEITTSDTKYSY